MPTYHLTHEGQRAGRRVDWQVLLQLMEVNSKETPHCTGGHQKKQVPFLPGGLDDTVQVHAR